jgi:hypothetical protein
MAQLRLFRDERPTAGVPAAILDFVAATGSGRERRPRACGETEEEGVCSCRARIACGA